ncbi:protein NLP7-like [Camellia sinensis]|uniref:protein NLP7-like n=1 Tax=Camellia sinensis TaxID=4442 RepID=UPI0010364B89|nr:protein NLP7-like [Camellia sinensis]
MRGRDRKTIIWLRGNFILVYRKIGVHRASVYNLIGMEREDLPHDFKEYVDTELNWLPLKCVDKVVGGVFWSRGDDKPLRPRPTVPADINLELKKKIRDVLYSILQHWLDYAILVQFWAPITEERQSFLTTQNQPFALVSAYVYNVVKFLVPDPLDVLGLCQYRMISKYNKFVVDLDGESSEEHFGLPGRVFKNQFPESTPNVEWYSIKEYSQRNDALRCGVKQSLAFPVFEPSTQRCVGVLEVVTQTGQSTYSCLLWNNYFGNYFGNQIYEEFEVVGLKSSVALEHKCMELDVDKNEARKIALDEMKNVLKIVCEDHDLPLVQIWIPCRIGWPCRDLVDGGILGVSCQNIKYEYYSEFRMVNNVHRIKEGTGVVGRALLSTNLVFCRDVTQLSITEYPMAHYARDVGLSGCFAICLQSSCTGNDDYVLEIFMPVSNRASENPPPSLWGILETVRINFRTFRAASGVELGKELCIERIDFQNGGKLDLVQMPQTIISLPLLEPLQCGGEITQVDSSNQQLLNAINNGSSVVNVVGTEGNNTAWTSPQEKGTVKTSERKGNKPGVKIKIPKEDILQTSGMSTDDAAKKFNVSKSTLKRICRGYGIERWPPRKINKAGCSQLYESASCLSSDHLPSTQSAASIVHTEPHDTMMQDANLVTIKVKYAEDNAILFHLSLSSSLTKLQQEVAKRLNLETGSYNVKYKDEVGDSILIACDVDLQYYMGHSRSLGRSPIVVLLEQKLPIPDHQKKKKERKKKLPITH